MELTGILKVKMDKQVISDKFSKREFVLTIDAASQYPQFVSMQLTNDKCDLLDGIAEGTELKVHINIRGKEWNGPQGIKYFNTIEVWKLEKLSTQPVAQSVQPEQSVQNAEVPIANPQVGNNPSDDLPF